MEAKRSAGSFAVALAMAAASGSGMSATTSVSSGYGSFSWRSTKSFAGEGSANGSEPVRHSKMTTARLNTSASGPSCSRRICSGAA